MRPQINSTARRSLLAVALLVVILLQSPISFACGPYTLSSVFTFKVHPEYPLEKFAQGEIGTVQPSYARSYLFVAYRYFNGGTFSPTEQRALVDLWKDRLDFRWTPGDENWVKGWQDARQKALAGPAPAIDVYRNREKPNQYESYLNCQQDAFETAAATVEDRIRKLGAENPALKQWVEAQDQVFANCAKGQDIPVALPADADALLRADRDYQIAAANFYAGNFDVARTQFDSIARDAKSPWRAGAPYMGARTLLRKASLGPEETKNAALVESEERLNKIIKTPELASSHAAARRLLNLVGIRLHPEARLHELGLSLASKTELASLKQDLWDYTILLDKFVGDGEAHHQKATPVNLQGDDLTDWITTLQSDKTEALDHSVERWQATSSVVWLVAALSKVAPQHAKAAMLQAAAARLLPSSPAFATASFHDVRLDIASGRILEARAKLDDLLRKDRALFNRSSRNLLHKQRMIISSSLDDFIEHAQRLPAGFAWDESNREIPVEEAEFGEELKSLQGKPLFDSDATEILNRRMPLALLSQAAINSRLPEHLRRDVTQAVWLRAVLLGDARTAAALVPKLKTLVPEMASLLDEYVKAREPAAKKFLAIYIWLKFPGLEPVIDTGVGRASLAEQDSYRDNWWCTAAFSAETNATEENKALPLRVTPEESVPAFLTAAQTAAGEKEYAMLAAFGAAPNYLSREVIEWATKNPGDRRVPEALHLAVKTSRYGCTDKQTGKWSKAAHDFLHRRYPNNHWTKQTPYWFKD
ncbi:MAG: hypothetical protein H7Z16_01800 [Pyrinomonadaceae bacterium]|nr:hypothetical protein [Pyrinomonadaceae bacterium]